MKEILDFNKDGLKSLHIFTTKLSFPVVAASYNDWEEQQLAYLKNNFQLKQFTTENLCQWCINQHIQYRIIFSLDIQNIFRNPLKCKEYIRLKRMLNYFH